MSAYKIKRSSLAPGFEPALAKAMAFLAKREYAAEQIRQKLKDLEAADDDIEQVIAYLQERGYQDDRRFGEIHIRSRLNFNPRGRFMVKQELKNFGLEAQLIEQLIEEQYPEPLEQQILAKFLAADMAKLKALPQDSFEDKKAYQKQYYKAARKAAAKGFKQDNIFAILGSEE